MSNTVANLRRQLVTSATAATLTISNTANMSFGGGSLSGGDVNRAQISGAIALTKDGSGTFTLGGTLLGGVAVGGHTHTGATKILAGILSLGEITALQNSAFDTANSAPGGAAVGLRTTVTTLTFGGLTGDKNLADVFTTTSGGYGSVTALTLNPGASATPSYSGVISNGASGMTLTKSGAGTQTLSGANSYGGNTTISAGTLQVGASEVIPHGTGSGNVTVTGTLDLNTFSETINGLSGAGTVNTVAGGTPTLTVGGNDQTSTFSGVITNSTGTLSLTKIGSGTVTLSGALSYSGATLVSAGKLALPSTHTGTGAATVSANATLGVTASGLSQWQPASLTLADPCTLDFASITNTGTTTAPILPVAAVGTVTNVTVNIISISGAVTPGNSYPLLGNQDGTTNGYALGTEPAGVSGVLDVVGTTLVYVVNSSADLWTGTDATNPTWWDIATSTNWSGKADLNTPLGSYADGDSVLFNDTASTNLVDLQVAVTPGNMIFANSTKAYIVTNSSGTVGIGGVGTLTKSGSGTLTLFTSNSYSGGTTLSGGVIIANSANALGTGPVTFAGGTRLAVAAGLDVTNAIIIGVNSGVANRGILENSGAGTATNSGPITINTGAAAGGHLAGNGGGILHLKGVITATTTVAQRTGTVIYSGGGTGYTNLFSTGTTMVGANDGIATTADVQIGVSAAATLDLNGFNQSLVGITKGANAATITNSSPTTPATLTLTGTSSYAGLIKDDGIITTKGLERTEARRERRFV